MLPFFILLLRDFFIFLIMPFEAFTTKTQTIFLPYLKLAASKLTTLPQKYMWCMQWCKGKKREQSVHKQVLGTRYTQVIKIFGCWN
jgi:hypothetical protein